MQLLSVWFQYYDIDKMRFFSATGFKFKIDSNTIFLSTSLRWFCLYPKRWLMSQ